MFEVNQGTQTSLLVDTTGGTAGTIIAVQKLDISPSGTAGTYFNGTVGVSSLPNLPGGSIAVTTGTIQVTSGTLNTGTVVNNGGTVGSVTGVGIITTVTNLTNGTIQNSGTVTGVGSISNIGSIGAITTGTIQNSGTVTGVGTITNIGSISTIGTMPSISANPSSGTLNTLGTLNTGTVVNNGGTLGLGTITPLYVYIGTTGLAGNGTIIPQIDVSQYRQASYQFSGTWTGTITFYQSDDGVVWFGMPMISSSNLNNSYGTTISANALVNGPIATRYIMGSLALNTGTVNGTAMISANPSSPYTMGVAAVQSGGYNVAVTSPIGTLQTGTVVANGGTIGTVQSVTALGTMGTLGLVNTITTVSSLTNGSIVVTNGTVSGGTIQLNQTPTSKVTSYGTLGTAGAGTVFGTIIGTAGAGTEYIVTDWSIVVTSGTPTVSLGFGTNSGSVPLLGTGVLDQGVFPPGGGLAKAPDTANHSGTNGAIYYGITAGSALIKVAYQTIATTI